MFLGFLHLLIYHYNNNFAITGNKICMLRYALLHNYFIGVPIFKPNIIKY